MPTLEERIKRIEDHLGFTESDERFALRKELTELYKSYGFSGHRAKSLANADVWCDPRVNVKDIEAYLIRRGAVKGGGTDDTITNYE